MSTNNTWTLIKHVAKSADKGLGKIDKAIYGPVTTHTVQLVPEPPPVKEETNGWEIAGAFLVATLFLVVIFTGVFSQHVKDNPKTWWI